MAKVLIFGTGAVGIIYAYICHKGGAQVTVVCRSNYEAASADGLTVESQLWGLQQFHPHKVVRSVSEAATIASTEGVYDFILVCSKAFPGTAKLIAAAVGIDTAIVLAQNGIQIEEEYASLYPSNPIISGAVYLPTTQTKPGYAVMGPLERFEIGTFPAAASMDAKLKAQQLSDIFTAGGANAPVFDDVQPQRWIKLAVNAAWNPSTALSLCDDGNFLRSSPEAELLIVKLYKEVALVAAAAGYPNAITDEEIERQLVRSRQRKASGGKEPSMLTDVRSNRPIEVEAILGNTIRLAAKLGVEVRYLELLYVLAKARNFQIAPGDQWVPLAM
jgi:2-dehydropantoate 2-reductase